MPICKKCNLRFKNTEIIDGKIIHLQRRKYCLNCSPYGEHNTKKIHNLTEEEKIILLNRQSQQGTLIECFNCGKSYIYDRSKGHTLTVCNSCMANRKRFSFKEKCVEYKGGKCVICNYNRSLRALEFHHLNPNEKSFSISGNHSRKWEDVRLELDKCILICSNCHMEIEDGLIDLSQITS